MFNYVFVRQGCKVLIKKIKNSKLCLSRWVYRVSPINLLIKKHKYSPTFVTKYVTPSLYLPFCVNTFRPSLPFSNPKHWKILPDFNATKKPFGFISIGTEIVCSAITEASQYLFSLDEECWFTHV